MGKHDSLDMDELFTATPQIIMDIPKTQRLEVLNESPMQNMEGNESMTMLLLSAYCRNSMVSLSNNILKIIHLFYCDSLVFEKEQERHNLRGNHQRSRSMSALKKLKKRLISGNT